MSECLNRPPRFHRRNIGAFVERRAGYLGPASVGTFEPPPMTYHDAAAEALDAFREAGDAQAMVQAVADGWAATMGPYRESLGLSAGMRYRDLKGVLAGLFSRFGYAWGHESHAAAQATIDEWFRSN